MDRSVQEARWILAPIFGIFVAIFTVGVIFT